LSGGQSSCHFTWSGIVAAAVIGLGLGTRAGIVPARKATGLRIVEALRYR
jgi:ABC-type lipoprotein release transport system permease subunit